MESLELGVGLDIVQWFQSWRTPAVEAFFSPFNPMGGTLFYLLLLPLIYWCVDASFGRRALLTFLVVVWLNMCLKQWWGRPRPLHVSDAVQPSFTARGPGLPSGHAMMATALWGMVAAHARRRPVVCLLIAYIGLMGVSRLVAGVHFPQDVLVGWLLGGASVAFFVWAEPPLAAWIRSRGSGCQVGLAVAATASMVVGFRMIAPWGAPVFWRYGIMLAGMFLGSAVGFVLERRLVRFQAAGRLVHRVSRFLLGGAVLLGLFLGTRHLTRAMGSNPRLPGLLLVFGGYAITGLWLSLGAPWLFVTVGWSRREGSHAELNRSPGRM